MTKGSGEIVCCLLVRNSDLTSSFCFVCEHVQKLVEAVVESLIALQKLHARGLLEQQVTLACLDVNMYCKKPLDAGSVRRLSFRKKLERLNEENSNTKVKVSHGIWSKGLQRAYSKCSIRNETFVDFYMSMWEDFRKGEK